MSDIKLTNRVDQAVARLTAKKEGHVGKIVQVMGPVVDIQFPEGSLPAIFNAIEIDGNPTKDIHIHLTTEVVQHIGSDTVRSVAMSSTDGLVRGMEAFDTGHPITVPVGKGCLGRVFNVLGEAVDMVGGPQIRNAGTIGGNTCNGVTSADSASTLHAWEAIVEITGKNGVRRVPIKDFYLKAGAVDLRAEEGEIQTAILIPKASYDRTWGHYIKYAMRNAMDIATLGTSVNARLSPDKKTFERVRIAFGVAGPVPLRALNAEAFINGREVTLENIQQFGRTVLEDIHPRDSWRASKAFRSHIAVESAKRCLMESVKLAGGEL